jgi:hypothetical protein
MKDIYEVALANCWWTGSGGGSNGGGSTSGTSGYPPYMEAWHYDALCDMGGASLSLSMAEVMNTAFSNSPYAGAAGFDPSPNLTNIDNILVDLADVVSDFTTTIAVGTLISDMFSAPAITDVIDAFELDFDTRVAAVTIPRFEAGMRDIGAVVSSAFAIGKSIIELDRDRQVAKFSADLRMKTFSDYNASRQALLQLILQANQHATATTIEANRLEIVASKEYTDTNLKLDEMDALWDLEVFKYGGNLLGAIAGSAVSTGENREGSKSHPSVLGGVLSGAAAGATIGTSFSAGTGTAIGGLLGGVLGAASSIFKF